MNKQSTMLTQQRARTISQAGREQLLGQQQQPGVRGRENAPPNPAAPAELSENSEWMRLTVDLPGVQLKDLDVNINHGVLTIEGSRRTMTVDGSVCVKKQKISRRYAIDTAVVDVHNATANLKFGVLTIKAPKNSKPNRVRVAVTENDEEGLPSGRNVTMDMQPTMIVLPVTTTPHIVAPIQSAPIPLTTSDEEARAMSPLSSRSTSPRVVIVKENHGVVQSGDGFNDSARIQ
jgi:HSP20 family molecular chaperone IbpA